MISFQSGLSISELLISLCLSMLIIVAVSSQYLQAKQRYLHIRDRIERSYELQLVSGLLHDRIKRAGFTPCMPITQLTAINGYNDRAYLPALELNNKSSLQVNRMSEYFSSSHILSSKQLLATEPVLLRPNLKILIADCQYAEVHIIDKVSNSPVGQLIQLKHAIRASFTPPVYVGEWLQERFYIKHHPGMPSSLYYHHNHSEELSRYVVNFTGKIIPDTHSDLVQLDLQLNNGELFTIETGIRAR